MGGWKVGGGWVVGRRLGERLVQAERVSDGENPLPNLRRSSRAGGKKECFDSID